MTEWNRRATMRQPFRAFHPAKPLEHGRSSAEANPYGRWCGGRGLNPPGYPIRLLDSSGIVMALLVASSGKSRLLGRVELL